MDDEDKPAWRSRFSKFLEREHEEFAIDREKNLRDQDQRRWNYREFFAGTEKEAEKSSLEEIAGKVSLETSQSYDFLQCHAGEQNWSLSDTTFATWKDTFLSVLSVSWLITICFELYRLSSMQSVPQTQHIKHWPFHLFASLNFGGTSHTRCFTPTPHISLSTWFFSFLSRFRWSRRSEKSLWSSSISVEYSADHWLRVLPKIFRWWLVQAQGFIVY